MSTGKQRYMERRRLEAEARLAGAQNVHWRAQKDSVREREDEEVTNLVIDCLASIADSLNRLADKLAPPEPTP